MPLTQDHVVHDHNQREAPLALPVSLARQPAMQLRVASARQARRWPLAPGFPYHTQRKTSMLWRCVLAPFFGAPWQTP